MNKITKITVNSNTWKASKARIMLLYGEASQNFVVYRGEKYDDSRSIELSVPKFGNLQIKKVDSSTGDVLAGIEFKVYNYTTKKWLQIASNGTISFVDKSGSATTLTTNSKGYANAQGLPKDTNKNPIIKNLPYGKYLVYETKIPDSLSNYYEITTKCTVSNGEEITAKKMITDKTESNGLIELGAGQTIVLTAENTKDFTQLQIQKIDETTGLSLDGIGFKIYSQDKKGWLKIKDNKLVGYASKSTDKEVKEITTDKSGLTPKIAKIPVGKYTIVETNLGQYKNIYQLNTITINNEKLNGIAKDFKVELNKSNIASFKFPNKQTYINLSGYVWEEIATQGKNEMSRNNTYDKDTESLINGIKVALKDNKGNVVKNGNSDDCITTTNKVNGKNGFYKFEKVDIDQLSNYHVEFEYDGITYQSIVSGTTDTSSKASETDANRNKFNNAFSKITGEGQTITNLNGNKVELKYNKNKEHNEALNTDITNVTLSNSFKIKEDTANKIITIDNKNKDAANGYTDYPIFAQTTSNYLKTQYDKLTKNSKKNITEIENINLGLGKREKTDIYVGKDLYSVKLSINGFNHIYKYGYKPDEYYEKKNASFNIGVQFMTERGIDSYTRPIYKSDVDYINNANKDKELKTYITYKISMVNDTTSLTTKVNSLVDYFDSRYNAEGIKVGTTYNDETGEITNELKVASIEKYSDKYSKMIIETNAEMEAKESQDIYVRFELSREQVAEILKGEEGNAPIDNVVEVNSYTTLQNGKVYASIDKDSIPANADPSKTTEEGNNETYEDDTDIAPSLVLTPFDDRTMSGTVFEDNATSEGTGKVRQGDGIYNEGEKAVQGVTVVMTQVDKNGNEVKDENGNVIKYTAEPTNNEGNFTISNYIPGYYKITYTWGKDQGGYDVKDFKATIFNKDAHQGTAWYRDETTRYSDAMDDYELRKNIDKGDDIKLMNSTTPLFGVGVDATGATDEGVISISEGNQFIRQDTKTMDFGIIERARQIIDLNKSVETIKITNAQGVVINDARVNENGELEGETKNLTGGPSYGYVKAEMEDEMIQGSTIEIGYKISVQNNSELDYDSEDFYHYGEIKGNVVKLRAEKLYDYLDSAIALDTSKEESESWVVKPASDILTEKETLIESYFNAGISEDGNSGFWETASEELTQIFTQWQEQITESMTVRNIKIVDRTVLENNLSKELAPGESVEEKINASTILSPSAEIRFENDVEIPEVTRTTDVGRNVDVTKSQLYDRAEWVGVTGPTGANKDYTMTIIISLSAIIILGAGVIFIKKKVL